MPKTPAKLTVLTSKDTGQEERVQALRTTYQMNVKPTNNLPADFMWFTHGHKYGIELKVAGDMLSSFRSGRLAGQIRKMVETLDFPLILWCAKVSMERATGKLVMNDSVTDWDYRGTMSRLSVAMMAGVSVEIFDGPAAERVAAWVINTSKEEHDWLRGRTRPPAVYSLDPAYSNAVWALCAHDGIGPETAEAMVQKYKSVAAVYNHALRVKLEELTITAFCKGVKGLGPKRAKSFIAEVT